MKVQMMDPAALTPYENNPRDNDGAVQAVANSIKKFGFKAPIITDKNLVIIAGHTRLKAALTLGLKEVPVIVADDLTPEQARAYRLADNKTGELATWLDALLAEEMAALENFDMSEFGFDLLEIEQESSNVMGGGNRESDEVVCCKEIIVVCKDEEDMEEKYAKIQEMGWECRILTYRGRLRFTTPSVQLKLSEHLT